MTNQHEIKFLENKAFIGYTCCKVSLAGFFVKKVYFAPILKRGFEDDGNTNSAR